MQGQLWQREFLGEGLSWVPETIQLELYSKNLGLNMRYISLFLIPIRFLFNGSFSSIALPSFSFWWTQSRWTHSGLLLNSFITSRSTPCFELTQSVTSWSWAIVQDRNATDWISAKCGLTLMKQVLSSFLTMVCGGMSCFALTQSVTLWSWALIQWLGCRILS